MADIYCATDGNDGGTGGIGDPFLTAQKGVDEANANDTLHFADGTYDVGDGVDLVRAGSDGAPITIQATNSRGAIWATSQNGKPLDMQEFNWINLKKIVFRGRVTDTASVCIDAQNCDNLNMDDIEVENTQGRGIWFRNSDNITLVDVEVHPETNFETTGLALDGIVLANVTNVSLLRVEIYHTSHLGVRIDVADGVTLDDFNIHDTSSHGIEVGDSAEAGFTENVDIINGILDNCGSWRLSNDSKIGIFVRPMAREVFIFRNQIFDCDGPGIAITRGATGPIFVYHNTLVGNNKANVNDFGELLLSDNNTNREPGIFWKNNIVYHETVNLTYLFNSNARTNLDIDYNLLFDSNGTEDIQVDGAGSFATYAAYQAGGFEPNSVVSQDPTFTNRGAEDFTLQPGSPALNAGVDLGLPFFGAAPDIGYVETWGDPPPTEPSEDTGVMVG